MLKDTCAKVNEHHLKFVASMYRRKTFEWLKPPNELEKKYFPNKMFTLTPDKEAISSLTDKHNTLNFKTWDVVSRNHHHYNFLKFASLKVVCPCISTTELLGKHFPCISIWLNTECAYSITTSHGSTDQWIKSSFVCTSERKTNL